MRRLIAAVRSLRRRVHREPPPSAQRLIDIRVGAELFAEVRDHVEDFSRGEEAGFLICSISRLPECDVLLAREWLPVPGSAIERGTDGSVLAWSSAFNSTVLERALDLDASPVLVHSHGSHNPRFSPDDRAKERGLFSVFSRLLETLPTGTVVLGDRDAVGSFWLAGTNTMTFGKVVIVGSTFEVWPAADRALPASSQPRRRLGRQSAAIGPASDLKLATAKVGVIGISGGGSHVVQQLAHQGVGTIIAVDDQLVDETNLGRMVGAAETDIDTTLKTDVAERVVTAVDHAATVIKVTNRFPSPEAIAALKEADMIVACVDRWDTRENINLFARRYLIPLVDVGLSIVSTGERLVRADGQVAVALPGMACLRCWLITDAVLADEREHRPPGYDQNPDAPGDPQVVSMNGTLASEACNCTLDLITGYSGGWRGAKYWQYEGRSGTLQPHEIPPHNPTCPACAQEGFGDPAPQIGSPSSS